MERRVGIGEKEREGVIKVAEELFSILKRITQRLIHWSDAKNRNIKRHFQWKTNPLQGGKKEAEKRVPQETKGAYQLGNTCWLIKVFINKFIYKH
ncbi:hypothetical protein D6764_03645 [Candidatus Woesearchaeota archaeon]|nr:MAG: hypothetical protein D6764_03645 [Candidatus Woesearchaeota archaeon]